MPIYNKHIRANGGACDYISARCTLGRTSCSVWGCSRRGCGDHYRADLLLWWMGLVSHVSQISNLGFNLNFLFIFCYLPSERRITPDARADYPQTFHLVRTWRVAQMRLWSQNYDGGSGSCSRVKLPGCCTKPTVSILNYNPISSKKIHTQPVDMLKNGLQNYNLNKTLKVSHAFLLLIIL